MVYVSRERPLSRYVVHSSALESVAVEASEKLGVSRSALQSVNFSLAVEEKLTNELQVRIPQCVSLLCKCEEEQKNVSTCEIPSPLQSLKG